MDLFQELGLLGLGSRFRRISEDMYEQTGELYKELSADLNPRAFPLLHAISKNDESTIGALAKELGVSHPAVIKMASLLREKELIQDTEDPSDKRKRNLTLTKKGERLVQVLKPLWQEIEQTINELIKETGYDLLDALKRFEEKACNGKYLNRVRDNRDRAKEDQVEIIPWDPKYREHFYSINKAWVDEYFSYEAKDAEILENPEKAVIEKGGEIFFALVNGEVVGTCALYNHPGFGLELTKMGVTEAARGKRIGVRLCNAAIEKAQELGVERLFLESARVLEPAIAMYRKLGFVEIPDPRGPSEYARADIYMEYPQALMKKAA